MHTTEEKAPAIRRGPPRLPTLRLVYSGAEARLPPTVITPLRGATRIGRDPTHGVALPDDPRASRHHATLHSDVLGRLRIVDEKSRNGTFVNGVRVEDCLVNDGDLIAVGDSYLVVRAEPEGLLDASVPSLLGVAPSIQALRRAVHSVGPTGATVLLLAESGCGKDVVARALHEIGRPGGPFVAVNCSAIPESLAESQLFGHLAGAFSGAVARPGLFRAAEGGTLFLDEVGDLPEAIQPKLLRVLQDRLVTPVGGTTPIACDVRIVAATNRDLEADIAARRFRGDLYARLSGYPMSIPLLRERREDILLLLLHALGPTAARLTPALAEALLLHDWPFNVRELLALASQLRIRAGAATGPLDLELVSDRLARSAAAPQPPPDDSVDRPDDRAEAADKEPPPDRAALEALLTTHRGVVADVARAMRRSRKQVYRWIADQKLDVTRFRG
ncbi:MAG: sigma 54-interacting transcriptional regulator [Byssovorax sp.]